MTENKEWRAILPGAEAMEAIMSCASPPKAGSDGGASGLTVVPYMPDAIGLAMHPNIVNASIFLKMKKITLAIDTNLHLVFVDRNNLTKFVKRRQSITDSGTPEFSKLEFFLRIDGYRVARISIILKSGQIEFDSLATRSWWRRFLHLGIKCTF